MLFVEMRKWNLNEPDWGKIFAPTNSQLQIWIQRNFRSALDVLKFYSERQKHFEMLLNIFLELLIYFRRQLFEFFT